MKAIILAGGSGERFWPLSTSNTPKQFLRIFDRRSLIRVTCDRLEKRFDPEDIIVITSRDHVDLTEKELPEIPSENIIGEPARMNTAPACALGAVLSDDDEVLFTVPADHFIGDETAFWKAFDSALLAVDRIGGLFTFGIKPTRPETGYGYIEAGGSIADGVLKAERFREKPDLETAKGFLEKGNFLWNSGMFLWRAGELLSEMGIHCPGVSTPLIETEGDALSNIEDSYSRVERISIDNALMERSSRVRVVPVDPEWSDVGSWITVRELLGYTSEGKNISLLDSRNVFVRTDPDRKVAVIGLEGITVVETEEGLLVMKEERSQDVKSAARKFRSRE